VSIAHLRDPGASLELTAWLHETAGARVSSFRASDQIAS